ncbi:carboxypeptidase-like regulatory domain-containing protein [Carboxylicivirga taeanensis]|uniref:carboxypeptidase-like regulatory domain-containing protein n=1 Tax=Carboxylicivirga taeanensis TaxID=1416875 RepID=UPI003F6DB7C2
MELLTFFARSILVSFLFLIVYQLFLSRDAHYVANRFFLLGGLWASLMLPFAELNYSVVIDVVDGADGRALVSIADTAIDAMPAVEKSMVSWPQLLLAAYGLIAGVFVLRLVVMVIRMQRLANASEQLLIDGVLVCINEKVDEPFVFGKRIFLKSKHYLTPQNAEILVHEREHLMQHHWIDVFVSELVIAVQWYNPFAWYYARLVKQNLEFLADRGVLKKGFQLNKYIQHIICETMGAEASVLANHFRFSQNKRRLKMMKNDKNSKWRLLKLLLVLPLVGSLLWAFSEPVYEYRSNSETINDTQPQEKKSTFMMKGKAVVFDKSFVQDDGKMTVVQKPLPGTSIIIKGTTRGCVADMKGEFELEVAEDDILVLSFVGYNTQEVKADKVIPKLITMVPSVYELEPSEIKARPKGEPIIEPNTKDGKPVFFIVEEMPSYNEGEETFANKLQKKVDAVKQKEELNGKVKVQFIVTEDGQLKDIKAINRVNEIEAKYAVKIISELNDWKPGKQRGKAVATKIVMPVEFD